MLTGHGSSDTAIESIRIRAKPGLFEVAHGGTISLDEIGR